MRHALPSECITPAGLARVVLNSRSRIVSGSPSPIGALFRCSRSFQEGGCEILVGDVKLVANDDGRRSKDEQNGPRRARDRAMSGNEFPHQFPRAISVGGNPPSGSIIGELLREQFGALVPIGRRLRQSALAHGGQLDRGVWTNRSD